MTEKLKQKVRTHENDNNRSLEPIDNSIFLIFDFLTSFFLYNSTVIGRTMKDFKNGFEKEDLAYWMVHVKYVKFQKNYLYLHNIY